MFGNLITLYGRKSTNLSNEEEQQLMIYGAQLIYLIRQFIQEEEILFHMATKTNDGKYETSAFIPQKEILKNLSATKKTAIGVSTAMQKFLIKNNQNNLLEFKRKNLWQRVEYLAEARYITGKNINKIDMRKSGAKRAHWAYQSQKKDIQVYLKFAGNQVVKYYDVNNSGTRDSLLAFNNGWLWEWYNSILYGGEDNEYLIMTDAIQRGSIKYVIQKPDFTPGTKEGDFQDLLGRQIQSKYGNEKIISFNNIRHIIFDLEIALTNYMQNGQNAANNLISVLNEHFFPESANIGSLYANDVVDQLLLKLNQSYK